MAPASTYYEMLDIGSTASTAQVRSAYLRLMKRHHPDVAGEGFETADYLPLINRAYQTLIDPAKRDAYDAELARRSRQIVATPWARSFAAVSRPPKLWPVSAGLAIFAGVAALILVTTAPQADALHPLPAALYWLQQEPLAHDSSKSLPSIEEIRRKAHLGANLSALDAAANSARCFDDARARASLGAAKLCVIFDDAFLYVHKTPATPLPLYFEDTIVTLRHSSALDVAPADRMLQRLWRAAFVALMADLRGSSALLGAGDSPPREGGEGKRAVAASIAEKPTPEMPQAGTVPGR